MFMLQPVAQVASRGQAFKLQVHLHEPVVKTFLDSGLPHGSQDYTIIVVIHSSGWGFHAESLTPRPQSQCSRGAAEPAGILRLGSFSSEELAALANSASAPPRSPEGVAVADIAMKDLARELYDYLVDLKGNIGLVGCSLGSMHISSLLANLAEFAVGDVRLSDYVRRIVFYDGSYIGFGYTPPEGQGLYEAVMDGSLSPEERVLAFNKWIVGYYSRGDVAISGLGAVEDRKPLVDPPPTIENRIAEEHHELTYDPLCGPNGSVALLAGASIMHRVLGTLKEGAFYLRDIPPGAEDWRSFEGRYVWCENSV
ncbi:hypothetical protein LXA43DRAFT_1065121 [Ganoderma leucocontextum]|nr:hypothetical protein LXA43DRAFT_1065121 [Ganoderma leucocontextum]